MSKFDRAIDRFCYKHPRFGVSNLMLYVVFGSAIAYIISLMDTTNTFIYYLYFNADLVLRGEVWRIVTFMFVPTGSSILWQAVTLYFYYFIGSSLEREWGAGKFTIYYFFGVIFTILYGFIAGLLSDTGYMVYCDSSYINLSMFFAFAVLFPNARVLLFFFIPVKIKWLAMINAVFFVYAMVTTPFPEMLFPLVAILNFLLFCGGTLFKSILPTSRKQRKKVVEFRAAVNQVKHRERSEEYRHKCAVCGKTDTENPGLGFRYCSQCEGYRCFCEEHINSHEHFR